MGRSALKAQAVWMKDQRARSDQGAELNFITQPVRIPLPMLGSGVDGDVRCTSARLRYFPRKLLGEPRLIPSPVRPHLHSEPDTLQFLYGLRDAKPRLRLAIEEEPPRAPDQGEIALGHAQCQITSVFSVNLIPIDSNSARTGS